jgi:hypothetical protein
MLTDPRRTIIGGGSALEMAFLVAFSQLAPAHTVTLFRGLVSLRVPRFPLIFFVASTLLSLTPFVTLAAPFLAASGFFVAWTYLRFYKPALADLEASAGPLRGDASDTFALAEFFPAPLRAPVAVLSDVVHAAAVSIGLCTPFSDAHIAASRGDRFGSGRSVSHGHGGSRAETERRRALALKQLDQRLSASTAKGVSPQPGESLAQAQAQPQPPQMPQVGAPAPGEGDGEAGVLRAES